MKKIYFILFASLFFLIPYDTFATGTSVPYSYYKDSNLTTLYDSINGVGRCGKVPISNSMATQGTLIFYTKDGWGGNWNWTVGQFDNVYFTIRILDDNLSTVVENFNGNDIFLDVARNIHLSLVYTNNNVSQCYLNDNDNISNGLATYRCLVDHDATKLKQLQVSYYLDGRWVYFEASELHLENLWLCPGGVAQFEWANNYDNSDVVGAIDDTTDAINDMNDNINNSNVNESSSTANGFFNGFRTDANGHLTSIVTAPLTLFSAMTSTTCNAITLPFNFDILHNIMGIDIPDKTITIPCGTTLFWENSSLAPKVTNFRTFWNLLLGAPLIYGCLVLLMKSFNNALDPLNDEVVYLTVSNEKKAKASKESDNSD